MVLKEKPSVGTGGDNIWLLMTSERAEEAQAGKH